MHATLFRKKYPLTLFPSRMLHHCFHRSMDFFVWFHKFIASDVNLALRQFEFELSPPSLPPSHLSTAHVSLLLGLPLFHSFFLFSYFSTDEFLSVWLMFSLHTTINKALFILTALQSHAHIGNLNETLLLLWTSIAGGLGRDKRCPRKLKNILKSKKKRKQVFKFQHLSL